MTTGATHPHILILVTQQAELLGLLIQTCQSRIVRAVLQERVWGRDVERKDQSKPLTISISTHYTFPCYLSLSLPSLLTRSGDSQMSLSDTNREQPSQMVLPHSKQRYFQRCRLNAFPHLTQLFSSRSDLHGTISFSISKARDC